MSVIDYLKQLKRNHYTKMILNNDNKKFISHCATSKQSICNGYKAARDILVYCHIVEKGLSHKQIKPLFGYDRISLISKSLDDYIKMGGNDTYTIDMAVSTLKKYNQVNRDLGVPEEELISIPPINSSDIIDIGATPMSKKDFFISRNASFSSFSSNRHSVRLYDCISCPIDNNTLMKCIEIAQNCPSACNRQAVRLKIITDRLLIKRISSIQGGSNGFGENSGAMIIVTSDLSLYEPYERRIPMLDCGLFVMNLVYALFENQIGSCILNASFTEDREKQMQVLVPIPENEIYAAVIALSDIPENEQVLIAHSKKRNPEDIVTFIK